MRKICIFMLLVLLCTGMVFAGGQKAQVMAPVSGTGDAEIPVRKIKEPETITVIDCYGKEVTIKNPIEKVVLLDKSGVPYAVQAIQGEDKIVGVAE